MHRFDHLMVLIETYQSWGYWIIFLVSALESLAVVGLLMPGTTITVIFGLLASEGFFNIWLLMLLAFMGAVIGDGISYWFGSRGLRYFKDEKKIIKASHFELGQKFFEKYGPKSIFLGRFIGPLRPLIPFIAGLMHMRLRTFFFWNITSAALWSVFYIFVGYFFGAAWRAIGVWPGRISAIFLVIIIGMAVYYARSKLLELKNGKT
ncbi:MAG: DedA family protein [Patescibacteria group bacterium]